MNMKRPITLLLALSLVLSCTGQWIVHAEEAEDPALDPTLTESAATATVVPADSQTLLAEDMPFLHFIDDDQFSNANHVARLPEEERLDTYVFLNQDGTKSVYHMGRNVKFVDADGIIKEKDTTLVAAKGGYTMRSNDVHLLLPQNASDGVFLSHSDHNVRLIPTGGNGKTVMSEDAILYADYYGDGIHLKYTPTLSGVKEDIILESYTGMSSFTFRLECGDLELYQRAGVWCLAPGEDAETVFTLGQIIVYDAIGKPVAGAMTVEPAENGAYVLTVSAPVEFLTDPTTVYPVTIDPTLQIKDSAGQLNIEDATIFSGYPYSNSGSFVYNTIGYTDANYQIGRLAVRLTGLLSNSTYQGLTVDEIVKVTFNIKDGGSYYSGVNIHAIVGNSTWTESSVRWIDIPSYSSDVYATATMGGSYWASFDITNLVKDWKTGAQNGQCGFLMVGVNEDTKKIGTISCEYGTGTHWPYAIVTYENNSVLSKTVLKLNEGASGGLTVQNPDNLALTWTSDDTSIATVSSTGTVTGVNAGTTTVRVSSADAAIQASCTVYVTIPDGVYYIQNLYSLQYLHVENAKINNLTNVIQYSKIAGNGTDRLCQLWKIRYIGDGRYTIRPMHKPDMGLDVTGTNVDIFGVDTNETPSNVPYFAKWTIEKYDTGYILKNNGLDSKTLQLPELSFTSGTNIDVGTYTTTTSRNRWKLIPVSDALNGILLYETTTQKQLTEPTKYMGINETKTLSAFNLLAVVYSSTSIGQNITWYSTSPGVATVDHSTGTVTSVSDGVAVIVGTAYRNGTYHRVEFGICVGFPEDFINLINRGCFNYKECKSTSDGFFISTTPMSQVLLQFGIQELIDKKDYSDTISVPLCYDDWYLYAVNNGTQIRYGLYKMREQEFDDEDGNNPGVTISFIAFDTSRLFTCLNDDSQSNQYELYKAFLRTVGPQRETHDDVLTQYFANTASTGPYLIGESYVSYIATTCADENGVIALPTLFSSNFNDSTRVRNALTTINSSAGYTITDLTAKTITVADTYNMTLQEKQAILCAFCTNATFNSFAAEVEFHADGIYDWRADIPIVGDTWYLRACRADMAIGEVGEEDPFTDYYDLDSDIVVAQRAIHGDR